MKRRTWLSLTVALAGLLLATNATAFSGTLGGGKGGAIKGANEHANVTAKKPCTPAGGAGGSNSGGSPSGVGAGSSEHGSVRGTINGSGDFIAPRLQEKKPQPRSVSPKLRSEPAAGAGDCK